MRVYIVGISCVGKTTVGMLLAEKLGYDFIDFDSFVDFAVPLSALRTPALMNMHIAIR